MMNLEGMPQTRHSSARAATNLLIVSLFGRRALRLLLLGQ